MMVGLYPFPIAPEADIKTFPFLPPLPKELTIINFQELRFKNVKTGVLGFFTPVG
jgi:hypothetical protein